MDRTEKKMDEIYSSLEERLLFYLDNVDYIMRNIIKDMKTEGISSEVFGPYLDKRFTATMHEAARRNEIQLKKSS